MKSIKLLALTLASVLTGLAAGTARASIAYGSINNFDTVNDTGEVCHGFEIELDDCHSTEITYTFDYNHYGKPEITEDNSVAGHPKCFIRWKSAKLADGSWAAYTAIPSGPISPTNGHQFTNPAVNFGGEHFGTGYTVPPSAVFYRWLKADASGALVPAGDVQVSTPTFTYYAPAAGAPAAVQAVIAPPPTPAPEPKEFGEPVWVKEIRTTTHNANKVKLRDLLSDDPDDANDKNWKNGEPDEVETEWQLLQTDYNAANGGANGEKAAAAEGLNNGNEVVTRRYEFYKYTGPLDTETGEAMADSVAADGVHGSGTKTVNGVETDLSTLEVVGEYTGAQMAAVDVDVQLALVDHLQDGKVNAPYTARKVVLEGAAPVTTVTDGALPAGLDFDEVTGIISGTPTESGVFSLKVTSSDGVAPDVSKNYTIRVAAVGQALLAQNMVDTTASPVEGGTTTGTGAYDPGANVAVVATANAGFVFVNWTDNGAVVSTTPSYTFVPDMNHSLVANFALDVPRWNIVTSADPVVGGTTSGDGLVDDGNTATVVATTAAGYAFVNWTEGGAQVSVLTSYTFTPTADRTLVAHFAPVPMYTVTTGVAPAATGTTTGAGSYSSGSSVTVTATPAAGYVFLNWKAGTSVVSTTASYTFTLTANKALVANFIAAGVAKTITTSASPVAGGTTTGGGAYATGDTATVEAVANPGYKFSKWKEGGSNVSSLASYSFTVAANRTLVATFTQAFVITATAFPSAGGTTEMDKNTPYDLNENAKAKAFPNAGWTFLNWTENGAEVSTSATYSFNATTNRTLVANFISLTDAAIQTSALPALGGTTSGDGVYTIGDGVTVSAAANPGYYFTEWTSGATVVSPDADYTFTAAASQSLVAHFALGHTITTSVWPLGAGSVTGGGPVPQGQSVTLTATATPGYTFVNWTDPTGTEVSTSLAYTFTPQVDGEYTANFSGDGGGGASGALLLANPNWNITLTDYGYSDFLLDNTPGFEGREYLSGEWGAAVSYTKNGNVVAPVWLEPNFIYPDWRTNSNFQVVTGIHDVGVNADGLPIAQSVIANGDLEITLRFEMLDTVVGTPMGSTAASAAGAGTAGSSNRYVLNQSYHVRNISGAAITNVQFFQLLHGLTSQHGVYDNRAYTGRLSEYHYDVTLAGVDASSAGTGSSTEGLEDTIGFHSKVAPTAFEIGHYGIEANGVDNHSSGKPSDGVHLSIEANWLGAPYAARQGRDTFAPANRWIAGGQRWDLGPLNAGQATDFDLMLSLLTGTKVSTGGGGGGGNPTGGSCNGGATHVGGLDFEFDDATSAGTFFGEYSEADAIELGEREVEGEFAIPTFDRPGGTTVTQLWNLTYSGTHNGLIHITFAYNPALLPAGFDESILAIYHFNGTIWEKLPGTVDVVNHRISVTTASLSPFALGVAAHVTISVSIPSGAAGGSVVGAGSYGAGDAVILQAVPSYGYAFTGWSVGGAPAGRTNPLSFTAAANVSYTANFAAIPATSFTPASVGGGMVLAWPLDAQAWTLEECSDLRDASWTPSSKPVSIVGGMNQVSIPASQARGFFRLVPQ